MRRVRFFQVDAFTRTPLTGNPAGVVLDADTLSPAEMQAIARELNNSETAFLLAPDGPDHDLRIRYFTPTTEVPSCGHATVAAHAVRARLTGTSGRVWHRIGAGRLPVDIEWRDEEPFVIMTQAAPRFEPAFDADGRRRVAESLGLNAEDLVEGLPVQWIDTGNSKVLVPVRDRAALSRIRPVPPQLHALHARRPNGGVFAFTLDGPDSDVLSHARMFAPNIGIPEDPVTGNGNGPLGAYLVLNGLAARDGIFHFRGRQGEDMGRPGTVDVWVTAEAGRPVEVRIGGHAVVVFEADLNLADA